MEKNDFGRLRALRFLFGMGLDIRDDPLFKSIPACRKKRDNGGATRARSAAKMGQPEYFLCVLCALCG